MFCLWLLCSLPCVLTQPAFTYLRDGRLVVGDRLNDDWIASGSFANHSVNTGWYILRIRTNGAHNDTLQAQAAGVLEAYYTKELVQMHWKNTVSGYCKSRGLDFCQRIKRFVTINNRWVNSMVESMRHRDPFWHHVGLTMERLQALEDNIKLNKSDYNDPGIFWMNLVGDLEDLEVALGRGSGEQKMLNGNSRCSALIKLLADGTDILASHVSWSGYQSMLRIIKRYEFYYHEIFAPNSRQISAPEVSFSSYPGIISSQDDFYILSSGLVTIETTIGNSNSSLWKFIRPRNTVMEWIRTIVANSLAASGHDWVRMFSRYNSGTYNNQWMIVDYKRFRAGVRHPLSAGGVLWLLEQLPGHIVHADVTSVFERQTYWPSYNTPYFAQIFNMSGSYYMMSKYGDWFSYERTPRAQIFRRDQDRVVGVASMLRLMRYNDFRHDPLSRCNCTPPYSAENAISARCELNPANGTYPFHALSHRNHGGIDVKLTNNYLRRNLEMIATNGPTWDTQPAFRWSDTDFNSVSHEGIPDLVKFDPVYIKFG